jgi:cytochrome c-type biogenesis protein CcmH
MMETEPRFRVKARRRTPLGTLRCWRRAALAGCLALGLLSALPVDAMEPREFQTAEAEQRFNELTEELRCTVCQNQSLADSDVPLAEDLRNEIQTMIEQGNSDEDIKRFLVDRYGDFVLYRPPVRGNTLLLWLAPLLLLTTGAVVMGVTIHRRRVMLAEEALAEARGGGAPDAQREDENDTARRPGA